MSRRELQALDTDTCLEARTRSSKKARISGEETGMNELKSQLAGAQRSLAALSEEVDELKLAVQQASLEAEKLRR